MCKLRHILHSNVFMAHYDPLGLKQCVRMLSFPHDCDKHIGAHMWTVMYVCMYHKFTRQQHSWRRQTLSSAIESLWDMCSWTVGVGVIKKTVAKINILHLYQGHKSFVFHIQSKTWNQHFCIFVLQKNKKKKPTAYYVHKT